ncbi:MAG: homoserine O-succinyltransferase [Anaerolineae bacterium]|jgi:homoserine O-succinyltransferase/O-acetyltransferase|nr:homoserine O-succinyltransferase [Anaerolineae bacterium]MBT7191641.1 homoserine O-succinyltransferase [Anaerolineae bacterium]MBT7991906.1 homoserine O-succinyltransferase [Anaerolineae bacterium]
MPLVAHTPLPSLERLSQQHNQEVLSLDQALKQDIRELHIGFLNMMPDSAFKVTELQFLRLVGSSNKIVQFYIHPCTVPDPRRSPEIQVYIDEHYTSFDELKKDGLDALIITGTNPTNPNLEDEPFWEELRKIIAWSKANVTSTLASCLSTHAIVQAVSRVERKPLSNKRWGVYEHRVENSIHPLLHDINTRFDVPHSRMNDVSRAQLEVAGYKTLVYGRDGGVHLAVSPDQFRLVFLQGHPEYDRISLLKEYKREIMRFIDGERDDYPPHPENYFGRKAKKIVDYYQELVYAALEQDNPVPEFPEKELEPWLDNTWRDTGRAFFNNWLGLVYQLTDVDRKIPFPPDIDPNDPLGLNAAEHT